MQPLAFLQGGSDSSDAGAAPAPCPPLMQFTMGMVAFLWPGLAQERRAALMPLHRFAGAAVHFMGLAAAATGLQEKATFLQAFGKKALRSGHIVLPAVIILLLACTGVAVAWQMAAARATHAAQPPLRKSDGDDDDDHDMESVPLGRGSATRG